MAKGYCDDDEQTSRHFKGGWFYPGDVGLLRADGRLIILGRQNDMINFNGINIFPSEIEYVLEGHPAVGIAAAFAIESTIHGQIPVAAVELVTHAAITEAELLRYARDRLALHAPRKLFYVPLLPKNAQGKLLRNELRKLFNRTK